MSRIWGARAPQQREELLHGLPHAEEHHCATLETSLIYEPEWICEGFRGVSPGREATVSKESGGK